jgi:phosphoribosylaminoimidazole (AIR) synthetase
MSEPLSYRKAGVPDADMLRTFNMGAGMAIVANRGAVDRIIRHLCARDCETYPIGKIAKGERRVVYEGTVRW